MVCMKPTLHPLGDLGEAFRLHRADLVRLAAFIVGDRGTGEDVVQDVFVRVHQRGRPVDGDLLPYLRAAVVNSCRNAVRRRLLTRRHAEGQSPCPPLTAEESVMLSEDRRQVLAALAALPRGAGKYWCSAFTWSCRRRKSPPCSASASAPSSPRPLEASRP